jgi:hypothetical protein
LFLKNWKNIYAQEKWCWDPWIFGIKSISPGFYCNYWSVWEWKLIVITINTPH